MSILFSHFDRSAVISLPDRTDRQRWRLADLLQAGLVE